jgi:hypothetical protein
MLLGQLELNESTEMQFGISVYGTTEQTQSVRFVIEGPEFDIACKCQIANEEVTATIPKLKGILPAGVYEARMECIVGDKIFVPLKEQIELNPLVEFDVKTKKVEVVKEGVKISVKKQVMSEDSRTVEPGPSKLEKNIQKCIAEGYEVSKIGENYIMKKGDAYVGLINETKILKAKKEYESLTEMINGLSK